MIKRILVPLDGSEYARSAVNQACKLAKISGAEVVGIAVVDLLSVAGQIAPIHAVALKAYHERLQTAKIDAAARIHEALSHFREVCTSAEVDHSEHDLQGIPAECVTQWACYCDLVVIGLRTYFQDPSLQRSGDSLARVLDRSVTPILAVPKLGTELSDTVLIAYDGSHHATRALHAVANLNLIHPFRKAFIITSHPDESQSSFLLKQASAYLRSHQLTDLTMVDTDRDITSVLHEEYLEKVNLVALGVHSKHPLKDFFVGSLTKSLIDYGHVPLLLAQ